MSTSQSQSVLSPAVSSTAVSPRLQKDLSSLSISNLSTQDDVDPDQLFTKHSVSEVKFIQHRLRYRLGTMVCEYILTDLRCRAEADAKQEELRLMVGCVDRHTHASVSLFTGHFESTVNDIAIFSKHLLLLFPLRNRRSVSNMPSTKPGLQFRRGRSRDYLGSHPAKKPRVRHTSARCKDGMS